MKIIVDIENKTLKMLENKRAVFKGEYGADKLILLINKELENEYPVITGLLSNGRRIGGFTTDSSYGTERIDGVTYTTAEFTLSKENGFTLSEGATQITIWMYKTKNAIVVGKEAIGNITFTVVNTTAFNDGDIIISGDVEGTVVNLKVELENLQAVAQINNVAINNLQNTKADKTELVDYLKRDGSKPMTGNLDIGGHGIDNARHINADDSISTLGELSVRGIYDDIVPTSDSDQPVSHYFASGIRFVTGSETQEQEYDLYYPKKSGTIALLNDLTKDRLIETIGTATQSLAGVMSAEDKKHLDTLVTLLEEDNDNVVNTISEILAIFNQYPEGAEILSVLNGKLNKSDLFPTIKENAEQTSTLDIGTSATFDATSDEQIPTSKAVSLFVKNNSTNTQEMINITYDELKALRDNAQLIPGQQYRITDYETTTRQPGTRSAGHQFDIIVTADNESTLNENARACPHYGDTYFGGGLKPVKKYTGTFKAGLTPENIIVSYTITIDKDGMYEGELKGGTDKIVELSYKDGTPIFYKNDVAYIESGEEGTDYTDEFTYNGQVEYEGETYDSWKKIEDGKDIGVIVYTNIVVENVVYIDDEVKTPQNAKLDVWELKYSLDNNIFNNDWGADFISIRTDDFNEFEFQYAGSSTVNGVNYTLWKSSLYHTNVFGDTYLLIKGDLSKVEEGALVSLYVDDPTGIYGESLEEDLTVVTQVTRGKGVIYYMKDEYDNECYYDFKNIQFLRKGVDINGDIVYTPNDGSKIIHNKHRLLIELWESSSYNYEEELTYGLTSFPIYTGLKIVNEYYDGDIEGYEDVCCTRYITVDSNILDADVHYLIPINEYDYKWFYTFNTKSYETFITSEDATVGSNVPTTRAKINIDYKHFNGEHLPNIIFRTSDVTDCSLYKCYNMFFNTSVFNSNFTNSECTCALSIVDSIDCTDSHVNVIYKNINRVKLTRALCNFFGEITESEIGYSCTDNIIRSCKYTKIGEFCKCNDIQVNLSTIGKSLHYSEVVTTGHCHIGNDNENIYVRGNYVVVGQNNKRLYIRGNYNTIGSKNDNVYLKGTANTIEDCVTDVRFVPENLTEEDSDEFNSYNCSNNIIKSHVNNLESLSSVRYSIFNNYCSHITLRINPRENLYAVEKVIIEPYAQYMTLQCTNSLMDVLVKNHCNHFSTSYVSINIPEKPFGNNSVTVITDSSLVIEEIDIQQ